MRSPLLVGAGGLLACGYVYAADPSQPGGFYPPCPTKVFTGLDCPFCGGLRATHSLLHGDVAAAIDYNALVVLVVLPLTVALFIGWSVQRWRGRPFTVSVPWWVTTAAVTAAIGFTVVRNVPGMPWGTSA
jgi:hypothetical protein